MEAISSSTSSSAASSAASASASFVGCPVCGARCTKGCSSQAAADRPRAHAPPPTLPRRVQSVRREPRREASAPRRARCSSCHPAAPPPRRRGSARAHRSPRLTSFPRRATRSRPRKRGRRRDRPRLQLTGTRTPRSKLRCSRTLSATRMISSAWSISWRSRAQLPRSAAASSSARASPTAPGQRMLRSCNRGFVWVRLDSLCLPPELRCSQRRRPTALGGCV